MATNYLSLRSSALPTLTATTLAISTLTGSTMRSNAITVSSFTASTITTSTMIGTVTLGQNPSYPNRFVELGTDAANSMYLDFHSNDSALPDYSTRIQSLSGATTGTGALNMYASTIGLMPSNGVGIGTTSPSDSLTVNSGNMAVNTSITTAAGYLFNQGSVWGGIEVEGNSTTGGQTLNLGVNTNRTKGWNSSYNGLFIRVDTRTGSNYNGFHFFNRATTSGSENEVMTILSSGNVGIGAVNPATGLHIYHSSNPKVYLQGGSYTGFLSMVTSGYLDIGFDTGAISGSTTGGVIRFYPNGSEAIRITNGGNLGIGTASTQAKFHLDNGSTQGLNALFYASGLGANQNTSIAIGKAFSASNSGTILWNHVSDGSSSNYLGLGVFGADNKLNVQASGNVGIGTTNPGAVLQINNNAASYTTAPTLSVSDGAADLGGTYGMLNLTRQSATADNKAHISLIRNGSAVFNIGYLSGSNTVGFLASSANMSSGSGIWIASNGNVGIATNNPGQTLDVYGTIARSGLKLPRTDYATISSANSISIPILFSDTQYNVVEIRIRYVVSARTDMTFSGTSTAPATMNIGEAQYVYIQYNQTAPTYGSAASGTAMSFASSVEYYGIDNNALIRITRASGGSSIGIRNHYTIDNVYCWYGVGTTRATAMGHFDCASVGGPALAYFNITCVNGSAQITGTYSTTHYN